MGKLITELGLPVGNVGLRNISTSTRSPCPARQLCATSPFHFKGKEVVWGWFQKNRGYFEQGKFSRYSLFESIISQWVLQGEKKV